MTVGAPPTSVHIGLVELDLLATHAGVPLPFPLRVPSFGRIEAERAALLGVAGRTLRMRGLADEVGPLGMADELVIALREHRGTVDLVLVGPEGADGIVALVYRSSALLCRQRVTDPAAPVAVRRIPDTALAAELLALIPDVAPAKSMPISLPVRAMRQAAAAVHGIEDDHDRELRLRDLVRDCGGDPGGLEPLSGLVSTVLGRGQLGATRRAGAEGARVGEELSWLDGPRGRVRVSGATDTWVSVNPLHRATLRHTLDQLSLTTREQR
jgi:ESAT-6 protein secretion system EspG family protein